MTEAHEQSRARVFVNRWIALFRYGPKALFALFRYGPKALFDAGRGLGYLEGLRDAPRADIEGRLFTPSPGHVPTPAELAELMNAPSSQEALRAAEARDDRIRRWNKR